MKYDNGHIIVEVKPSKPEKKMTKIQLIEDGIALLQSMKIHYQRGNIKEDKKDPPPERVMGWGDK